MAYKIDSIRGKLVEPIFFNSEQGGRDLYNKIKDSLLAEINVGNIIGTIREDFIKSGGFFGTKVPMIVLSNSLPENKYFDIGIYVNEKLVSFVFLGESKENTKRNKKEYYKENGNALKASFIKINELKLQQEAMWQQNVIDWIEENLK